MSEIKGFEDLKVWQKSLEFVLEVYKVTQQFPNEEKFGLMLSGLINSLKNLKSNSSAPNL